MPQWQIPFFRPSMPAEERLAPLFASIVRSGRLHRGPHVEAFEAALADRLQVRNVIATSSGTTALMLTYKALDLRERVLVPSYTFMATVTAMAWMGVEPVFADIARHSWGLSPTAVRAVVEQVGAVEAIVAVHPFGAPAEVVALEALATELSVPLLFDAAQAFGAQVEGRAIGCFGRAEVFSTSATKLLTTGEGGFVATDDDLLAERIRLLANYGDAGGYDAREPGINGRMPELSAALGLEMLRCFDEQFARRLQLVEQYCSLLSGIEGISLQNAVPGTTSAYKDLVVLIEDGFGMQRDQVGAKLAERGIETKPYFSPPVHRQSAFSHMRVDLPVTDHVATRSLALPLANDMSPSDVEAVVEVLHRLSSTP